jgi:ketosteroid isomerase-like protein
MYVKSNIREILLVNKAFVLVMLLFCGCASGGSMSNGLPATSGLYVEIQGMDNRLTEAFNAHDASALMSLFGRDIEFYHDTQGLQNFDKVASGFKELFAADNEIERQLVPGTLEVYPIKDYGAIETGVHRFCHTENGKIECGDVRFVMIWRREDDQWRISRVVSYGH